MPYTPAQHRLFQAAAHNPALAKARGIPMATASKMASEGIKAPQKPGPKPSPQRLAQALMKSMS